MKFIQQFRKLSHRQDREGLYAFLEQLANDNDTFSTKVDGFGSCLESQEIYFYYSQGEVAFMLVDKDGTEAELADEEKFNDDNPLWFSESSHRISPFARLKAITDAFMSVTPQICDAEITDSVSILVSNTYVINFEDYVEVYDGLDGLIIHNIRDINRPIATAANNEHGQRIFGKFMEIYSLGKQINGYFDPYRLEQKKKPAYSNFEKEEPAYSNFEREEPEHSDGLTITSATRQEYFTEKELDDFFSLEDPDFKRTEEAVNVQTGETMTVRREEDMPAVTILESLGDPHEFLSNMVGLDDMKTAMSEVVAYAKYTNRVKEAFPEHPSLDLNLHTIITGNPGTGKTTMCRIYGSLLHKAGVLSKGHTVVASRSSFIGQQFGVEEKRMRQCLKLAQGGCLFIDEAGQLINPAHPHDPGRGVIQLMLQLLSEEENRDIAVVLALYANDKSLNRLYELNPGIKSRFLNVLTFPDYTWTELLQIAHRKMKMQGLSITPGGWQKFCKVLKYSYDNRDRNFGNAREVVNLLQRCVVRHAVRCETKNISGNDLLRLTAADVPEIQPLKAIQKLGFS